MSLDQFELLELRGDDGIQTFYAREISTARPVQVHFLASVPETLALLSRIHQLPDAERRKVIDRGVCEGRAYVVTDRLAGFANLREWLESKTELQSVDRQLFELFDSAIPEPVPEAQSGDPVVNPMLGLLLGVAVAILFLALLIVIFVFHPK